ncbi:MAG TPA: hypothetical protein VHK91_04205 [Flavisolibacter sp.]|jgi:hypothetical protein|nr:hypothetical protein [Flavisolibacter sp.]
MKTRSLVIAALLLHLSSYAQNTTTANGTSTAGASSFVCLAGSFSGMQYLNTPSYSDYTHFDLLAGAGCSYWLHSTLNGTSAAGSYAGFHVRSSTVLSLLPGIKIETYLNGTRQESVPGADLVDILALGEGDLYFKTAKDFNEIRIVFGGLLNVAYSMDIFYGYGLGLAPTGNVLPLRLLQFEAKESAGGVQLNWTIDTDEAIRDMIVEASQDGNYFTSLQHLKPGKESQYRYTDLDKSGPFYRLQILTDKQRHYSTIIRTATGNPALSMTYNNPVKDRLLVTLSGCKGIHKLMLTHESGQQLFIGSVSLNSAISTESIDTRSFPRGLCILAVAGPDGQLYTRKLMLQ